MASNQHVVFHSMLHDWTINMLCKSVWIYILFVAENRRFSQTLQQYITEISITKQEYEWETFNWYDTYEWKEEKPKEKSIIIIAVNYVVIYDLLQSGWLGWFKTGFISGFYGYIVFLFTAQY